MIVIIILILACGVFFYLGGAVGIIRFPDFYSRLHPAGKLDTAGLFFSTVALVLYILYSDFSASSILTGVKIMLIVVFVFITSPTATHAIIDAGFVAGLRPWTKDTDKEKP